METRLLAGTEVTTTVLGFGCGGIFRLPRGRDRRVLLETARDVGIRHFDVAPTYGLGRAEAELAPVIADDRARLTVTTKFGLEPTVVGRAAGWVQTPLRAALVRWPALQQRVDSTGRSPDSGVVGRTLYTAAASPTTARRGLSRSLKTLHTDHIDVFAVHEPAHTVSGHPDALADCLDRMQADGSIRCWAVAGEPPLAQSPAAAVVARAPVGQCHDDIFSDRPTGARGLITYGAFARAVPVVAAYLRREPHTVALWSERLQADLADPAVLPALLLREAVRRNPNGSVVFSTTRPERVRAAATAVATATSGPAATAEAAALATFAAAVGAHGDPSGRS